MSAIRKSETLRFDPFEPAKEGHNNALWKRARICREWGIPHHEASLALEQWRKANFHRFLRPVDFPEVRQQVDNAYVGDNVGNHLPYCPKGSRGKLRTPKHTHDPDVTRYALLALRDFDVFSLIRESPVPQHNQPKRTTDVLRLLFGIAGEDPFVCVGQSMKQSPENGGDGIGMVTKPLSEVKAGGYQFVVPNPMRARTGLQMASGRPSTRCRDNSTTEAGRLFYVVEWDQLDGQPVSKHDQAKFLWFLSLYAENLIMVVDSGNKSLQGWFWVQGLFPSQVSVFWNLALSLGCDPAGARPEQAFRGPLGWRFKEGEEPKQQRIVYFNPMGGIRR